ncbi:hypothetical protein A0H81_04981 [Grifola frondosa]|uniref:NADP-dependent oxidoreductase domain-containing protein n=1 Tax=Grifola frondosa TaxID=5627 RepID=A0A1C7MFS2_GRIFR|nr:hypothetical protein A0H81_04981 [Grifola frondosa]
MGLVRIFDGVKNSLQRLQLDYIDLKQDMDAGHPFDYDMPIEETMQVLHDVVKAGYVRYICISSCYAYQFHTMQKQAHTFRLNANLIYREEEREIFSTLKVFGVGAILWSTLAWSCHSPSEHTHRSDTDKFLDMYQGPGTDQTIERGVTAPIVGMANLKNLEDTIGGVHVKLINEDINYLKECYRRTSSGTSRAGPVLYIASS